MQKSTLVVVTFLLVMVMQGFAQKQVTATNNLNLRPSASTQEAPIPVISRGSLVALLQASPTAGFMDVQASGQGGTPAKSTSSGKSSKTASRKKSRRKLVRKPQQREIEPLPTTLSSSNLSGSKTSACAQDLASCADTGCSPADSTHAIANQHKRAAPSGSGAGTVLTFDDFAALQQQADNLVGEGKELTADDRAKLSGMTVSGGSVAEGDLVSVVGYLVGTPHPNTGESVNCNLRGIDNNDFHIPVSSDPSNTDFQGVVVEMIPQNRPAEWNIANLTLVENNQQLVMISGGLFYDNLHHVNSDQNHPKGGQPHRFALWEIHPITQFMVCTKQDNNCDPSQPGDWAALGSQ